MESSKRLAFLDIETTGFSTERHEIIEIAVVLIDPAGWKVIEEVEIKIQPQHLETADPKALRINGYNETDWMFAYTLEQGMKLLAEKTKGAIMIAHNISFDWSFLKKAFEVTGIEPTFHFRKLDSMSIAWALMRKDPDQKFSMKALAKRFGVENENAHTALADTRALAEIFKHLMAI